MRLTRRIVWCVTLICLLLTTYVLAQKAQAPSAAAEQRVGEIIQLINSGDRTAARSYINQNYTAATLKEEPLEDRIDTISQLRDLTRGVELQSIKEPKPNSVRAIVRAKLTGQLRELSIELEPSSTHQIAGFDWVTHPTPMDKQPDRKLSEKEIVRELDAFMQKLAAADIFSGVVLLARDGRILFHKAYGEANKDFDIPNRLDTKFNLASLNKMFTSVAVAQLVEQGKLSYDDPLSKFVPDFPSREAAEKIKIKHLLTHTSGLGSYSIRASR